ncbi:MAG: sigma-54-dependent transcriptional regulator [Planctomycetota bacterium]|jgi:DNA-binding NtrC family response regulator
MSSQGCRILIVDDEPIKRSVMEDELRDAGYDVTVAGNALAAQPCLEANGFDVVLTDLRMPGQDGISFLRDIRGKHPDLAVIVMTAYGTVETAVAAMKLGAFDYIQKPFPTEELLLKLDRAIGYKGLSRENKALREALSRQKTETKMVGASEAIRRVMAQIHAVAGTDTSVLITGESGTGKELAARTLHEASHRSGGPFVAVSCAALPRELVETELFGHETGAFTGAGKRRAGRFELAHGGTLFLDDVDDIPVEVQVKLLRVLQDRTFERVGGEESLQANVRVVSATKRVLAAMVTAGQFREDLYYRLNVVPIGMPPLRDRLEDIPLLVDHFLRGLAVKLNRGALSILPEAVSRLQRYQWPGNVRQLENLLEQVAALSGKSCLDAGDFPEFEGPRDTSELVSLALGSQVEKVDLAAISAQVEGRLIKWALDRSGGNLARTAEILGIPRSTLQYKIGKLGKPVPQS